MRKQFHQVLGDIRAGELNEELTAGLTELVQAVQNTQKAGSLTLKIKITPTKGLAFEIDDEVVLKLPELAKPTTILFPTVEGNLVVQNPMQKQLPLQMVNDGGTMQLNAVQSGPTTLAKVPGADEPVQPINPAATGTEGK